MREQIEAFARTLLGLRTSGWFKPFRSAGTLLVGRTAGGLFTLAYLAMAARTLGVSDFGALMLIQTLILAFGDLITFPSWQAVLNYGTKPLVDDDREQLQRVLKFTLLVDLLGGALAMLAVLLLMESVANLVGIPADYHGIATFYGLSAALVAMGSTPQGILRLLDRFDLLSIHTAITPAVRTMGAIILVAAGAAGVGAFLLLWVVSWMAGQAYVIYQAVRELRRRNLLAGADWSLRGAFRPARGIRRFAVYANFNGALTLVQTRLGLLVAGWLLGPAAAGLLRIASQLADLAIRPVIRLLVPSLYPELSRLHAQGQSDELRTMMIRTMLTLSGFGILFIAVLALFGQWFIVLLAGEEFTGAYAVMLWLAAGGAIAGAATPVEPLLLSCGRIKVALTAKTLASLVYAAALFGLVQSVGLAGAGMAFVCYALVLAILLGYAASRLQFGGKA